ncbi:HAD family hydrolase [Deinococcus sp.]|uniref:HAD family hydrolase n=1 Tax=Deinococcus sp. TaxID=47478 RepID=UPI0025C735B4|nr:HAD family phosphatase [Deinococcus sp.]
MTSHPPLRAVLFDRDDTIAYTDHGVYREAALWAAQAFGLDPREVAAGMQAQWEARAFTWWHLRTQADEDAFWSDYSADLAARLGLTDAQAQQLSARYPYEAFMKPVPNAREVLGELRARGLRLGVLSNTLPSIDRTLTFLGLNDLIDVAVATCTVGIHKPNPGAYRHALIALGVDAAEVLFIDDKQENVDAARALGMHAALIDLSGQTPDALHDLRSVATLVDRIGVASAPADA